MIAYIGGPYRGKDKIDISVNIANAMIEAQNWWKEGFSTICPHANSAYFDEDKADYLGGYIEILSFCDLLVLLPQWQQSEGTKDELLFAKNCALIIAYQIRKEENLYMLNQPGEDPEYELTRRDIKGILSK